jgi:hypothetical protein
MSRFYREPTPSHADQLAALQNETDFLVYAEYRDCPDAMGVIVRQNVEEKIRTLGVSRDDIAEAISNSIAKLSPTPDLAPLYVHLYDGEGYCFRTVGPFESFADAKACGEAEINRNGQEFWIATPNVDPLAQVPFQPDQPAEAVDAAEPQARALLASLCEAVRQLFNSPDLDGAADLEQETIDAMDAADLALARATRFLASR